MSVSPLRHARWWLAACLLLAALIVPATLLPPGRLAEAGSHWFHQLPAEFSQLVGPRSTLVRTGAPGLSQELRWQGRLQLNETEDEVLAVEGPLRFSERREGLLREWRLSPQADGSLLREYRIDGVARPLDEAGRHWVGEMLKIALDATEDPLQRVRRIFERTGLDGLQRFVGEAQQDGQRRARIEAVLKLLPPGQRGGALQDQLLASSAAIRGAFEQRHALQALGEGLDAPPWAALLAQAATLDSDFERAELLVQWAGKLPAQPALIEAWSGVLAQVHADFEQRRVLEAQLRAGPLADWRLPVLRAAAGLGAAFEQRQLQQTWLRTLDAPASAAALPELLALAEASRRIDNDFERRQLLVELLRHAQLGAPALLQAVLTSTAGIGNDFERLQVLQTLAPLLPADGSLDADYRRLSRGFSPHERGLAEQALDR